MKCEEARAAFLAGELDAGHRDHLRSCPDCTAVAEELGHVKATLDDEALWQEPSAGLEDRLVTLISGTAAPPARRTRRGWWVAAAAVAAAVLTAGAFMMIGTTPPDWQVALPGTEAAPGAEGVVRGWNEPGGTRLQLEIDGLGATAPGNVYEVWFSRGPVHISAGTFSESGTIDMWTGIARRDYPRIWITLETLDTDESPSALTVMDTG